MFRVLVKTETLAVDERIYTVRYFALRTARGGRRYSADILLGPGDRIILDDDSVTNLEARTATCPAGQECCDVMTVQGGHEVCNVALADGSVRGLRPGMDPATWRRLMLPRDGEPIGTDW